MIQRARSAAPRSQMKGPSDHEEGPTRRSFTGDQERQSDDRRVGRHLCRVLDLPRVDGQFQIIAETRATMFGTGAAYLRLVQNFEHHPVQDWDPGSLHTLMSTGSTMPDSTCQWVHDAIGAAVHLSDVSGGTDVCSAFLGSNPLEPVRLGRLQGTHAGRRHRGLESSRRAGSGPGRRDGHHPADAVDANPVLG